MANIDLTKYGITGTTEIVHNPSYETLFAEETKPELTGYEVGTVTELGAVNVMTGIYTGRSPKDKFIKKQPELLKQYNELFVLPTDFPELIIEVITAYTTNQYAFEFFPNLLYHIYLHMLVIFMEAIKLDYFELPIIITSFFKLSFIKQQDIANTNNNNLKEYYQANYIILSQTSSILGCYLILSDNNYQYIKKEQLTELINSLITVEQYKPAFQNMKNQLDDLIDLLKTPNLFPDVLTIEKELSTTDIKITNSVKVFADFLNNMIKEN